jgi:hypothetical protein
MTELRDEMFIGAAEKAVPGRNRWVANICRRAKFRPRFVRYGESLAETLSPIVSEHAVALVPDYVRQIPAPGSDGSSNRRRRCDLGFPCRLAARTHSPADLRVRWLTVPVRNSAARGRVEVGQIIRTPARGMGILPVRTDWKR